MEASGVPWWVGTALALLSPALPSPALPGGADAGPAAVPALAVLHHWDAARATAWAAGDVLALRRLYTPRSAAGRADVRLLRRYLARGLRVQEMATQVFSARVLADRPHLLRLVVVERLAGGVVGRDGVQVPLPRDRAERHTITLRRVGGRWLVAGVR